MGKHGNQGRKKSELVIAEKRITVRLFEDQGTPSSAEIRQAVDLLQKKEPGE